MRSQDNLRWSGNGMSHDSYGDESRPQTQVSTRRLGIRLPSEHDKSLKEAGPVRNGKVQEDGTIVWTNDSSGENT